MTIALTEQQTLTLSTYRTQNFKVRTNTWLDLMNIQIECPNDGVFKNVSFRVENTNFWYEYQCYSSQKKETDYGAAIMKFSNEYYTYTFSKRNINLESFSYLNDVRIGCSVDYALKSFLLRMAGSQYQVYITGHGMKTSFQTKYNIETEKRTGNTKTLAILNNILIGRIDKETTDIIGYPLRGFMFNVQGDTLSFIYSYAKLKNMNPVLDSYKQRFKDFRDKNDQKN